MSGLAENKNSTVYDALQSVLGASNLLVDDHSRILFAQDVFTKDKMALAVARPTSKDELSAVLKVAQEYALTVVPRGGGMSYTSGYVPSKDDTLIIDMGLMTKVLEINKQDMYVTVECGCTWKKLHEELKGSGLRTPFWGTLSGSFATVGGGLSQNAVFWGTGQFGTAADSVVGLEVVLADGSVLKTGAGAQINSGPFFRHYGPDLTGLFTCDAGALGFKAHATLRLIPEMPAKGYLAFDFKTANDALDAMSEISRKGLAAECFGFDPYLQAQRVKRESLGKDIKALAGVMKSSGSVLGALKDGAKVALAGRGYMKNVVYSVQIIVEDRIPAGVDARLAEIRQIGTTFSGREIENSIPKITRANPFGPVNNMLGPEGERWVPIHGLFPHSKTKQAFAAIGEVFEKNKDLINKYSIGTGHLFAVVSTNCFVLEPVFFWPDAFTEIHEAYVESDHIAKLKRFDVNLDARKAVQLLRTEIGTVCKNIGGVHMQIGKAYQYKEGIEPNSYELVKALKKVLDPQGRVNPNALGLG
ncbi:FAD-binding protein [Glaciecola punicea]|jgi:FAD/FMN-containing dehydrogenase|uniref:FAD-binding oxidoreductase n=1 Tax=Glaciecola punicea TaxID=56804 RepID=UPI000872AC33|nr:FAD-binding oxidoreductase [Glaciecola punicea]OFA29860.1 FAD-binding protein [Glaciecola punicea]